MKILIVGLGSFGSELARKLAENDIEVHGIDLNPTRLRKNNFLARTFQLDACLRDELIKLQLEQYDKVLICLGSKYEKCNLITSLLLPHLTEAEVIVQYLSEIQKKSLEAVNITHFINPLKTDLDEIVQQII